MFNGVIAFLHLKKVRIVLILMEKIRMMSFFCNLEIKNLIQQFFKILKRFFSNFIKEYLEFEVIISHQRLLNEIMPSNKIV